MILTATNPDLDLTITRTIKAPRTALWAAWTEPEQLEQWWVPAPAKCRVVEMEFQPGGSFTTEISENGDDFGPHLRACVLAVDPGERIVFTDALIGGWRPADKPFMTAIISLKDHPAGTEYVARVLHKSRADRDRHEQLGFFDGWGTVMGQLAAMVEPKS